jgi:hypothetical protein
LYRLFCWTCKHPLGIHHAFLLLRCILDFDFLQHHCYCEADWEYHLPMCILIYIVSLIPLRCRMWRYLAVLRSFFHSSLLYTLSLHPFPPTSLPSSLTSFFHLFLGQPLSLVVSKFTYNTCLGILFSVYAQTNVTYLTLLSLLCWCIYYN